VNRRRAFFPFALLVLASALGGCASQKVVLTNQEADPWEAYNRKIYSFNMALDKAIARPVAKGYNATSTTPSRC